MIAYDRDVAETFLRAVHGDQAGYLCIMTARPATDAELADNPAKKLFPHHTFQEYPARLSEALDTIAVAVANGHHAFHGANLFSEPQRLNELALPPRNLFADLDGAPLPSGEWQPTLVVESSPGRYHVYYQLSEPVDTETGTALNQRLVLALKADKGAKDGARLLRIPGTWNVKPERGEPTPVKLLHSGTETYSPTDLDKVLPPLPAGKTTTGGKETAGDTEAGSGTVEPPVRLKGHALDRWHGKRPAKNTQGDLDTSASLHAIAHDLARAGATEATIIEAINERDMALGWHKYTSRPDAAKRYEEIAAKAIAAADEKERAPSQATLLIDLAQAAGAVLWHDPDGEPYATVQITNHRENWRLRSKQFRDFLARLYYTKHGSAAGSQAIQDALNALAGMAVFEGKEHAAPVRVAGHGGDIYLDLADPEWRAVKITAAGWGVITSDAVPVKFRRPKGVQPLPEPVRGGDLDGFRDLLNLPDDDHFKLVVGWLVVGLRPDGPYLVLDLTGEQGSAKSTTGRLVRQVIDPNRLPLRSAPREERDLAIAATNSQVVGFDNLSFIPDWLSDALCRVATGGGFGVRTHYENDEETLFDFTRPIVFTAITEAAVRGDLLDRALAIGLPPVTKRRTEADIESAFLKIWPATLGVLLDAVSAAIRNLPTTTLARLPRMADFALWVAAAAPAFGWEPGAFLAAYEANRESANEIALESSPLVDTLRVFLAAQPLAVWENTASALLQSLNMQAPVGVIVQKGWPKAAHVLSGQLKRLAPNLRKIGIEVEVGRMVSDGTKHGRKRVVRITRLLEGGRNEAYGASKRSDGAENRTDKPNLPNASRGDEAFEERSEAFGEGGNPDSTSEGVTTPNAPKRSEKAPSVRKRSANKRGGTPENGLSKPKTGESVPSPNAPNAPNASPPTLSKSDVPRESPATALWPEDAPNPFQVTPAGTDDVLDEDAPSPREGDLCPNCAEPVSAPWHYLDCEPHHTAIATTEATP